MLFVNVYVFGSLLSNKDCTTALAEYFNNSSTRRKLRRDYILNAKTLTQTPCNINSELESKEAAGEDGIITELWNTQAKIQSKMFTRSYISVVEVTETTPRGWTSPIIHPLHNKADKSGINKYR